MRLARTLLSSKGTSQAIQTLLNSHEFAADNPTTTAATTTTATTLSPEGNAENAYFWRGGKKVTDEASERNETIARLKEARNGAEVLSLVDPPERVGVVALASAVVRIGIICRAGTFGRIDSQKLSVLIDELAKKIHYTGECLTKYAFVTLLQNMSYLTLCAAPRVLEDPRNLLYAIAKEMQNRRFFEREFTVSMEFLLATSKRVVNEDLFADVLAVFEKRNVAALRLDTSIEFALRALAITYTPLPKRCNIHRIFDHCEKTGLSSVHIERLFTFLTPVRALVNKNSSEDTVLHSLKDNLQSLEAALIEEISMRQHGVTSNDIVKAVQFCFQNQSAHPALMKAISDHILHNTWTPYSIPEIHRVVSSFVNLSVIYTTAMRPVEDLAVHLQNRGFLDFPLSGLSALSKAFAGVSVLNERLFVQITDAFERKYVAEQGFSFSDCTWYLHAAAQMSCIDSGLPRKLVVALLTEACNETVYRDRDESRLAAVGSTIMTLSARHSRCPAWVARGFEMAMVKRKMHDIVTPRLMVMCIQSFAEAGHIPAEFAQCVELFFESVRPSEVLTRKHILDLRGTLIAMGLNSGYLSEDTGGLRRENVRASLRVIEDLSTFTNNDRYLTGDVPI